MARSYFEPEVIESGSALLEIIKAGDYEGTSKDNSHFEKLNLELRVISYVEQDEDDGEWIGAEFTDGCYYKENKAGDFGIPPRGKLPEVLKAAKGEDYFAGIKTGRIEFEPEDLVGSRFRATISQTDKGYSTVLWNTISPAKKQRKGKNAQTKLEEQTDADMKAAEKDAETEELAKDKNNPLMKNEDSNEDSESES